MEQFKKLRTPISITVDEGWVLYGLVRALKPEVCVEVGTQKAYSTHCIAQALEDNEKGHVWTYDILGLDENLDVSPVGHRITAIKGSYTEIDQEADFMFLDGPKTTDEFNQSFKKLKKGGLIIMHDADAWVIDQVFTKLDTEYGLLIGVK